MKQLMTASEKMPVGGLLLALLILLAAFPACQNPDKIDLKDNNSECDFSTQDGYRTMVQGAGSREYILHVPDSYDSNQPTPLLINFHGFGDCAGNFSDLVGEFYGLNALADSETFLVAYPQALVREKGSAYWEPADSGGQDINVNDVYWTEQLIADIANDYNVDIMRVYATGYSNGGMMAYELACSGSDFIAAVGIMSGVMLLEECNTNEYTSILHFHGIEDEVLPYDGNQDYQPVAEMIDFWVDHNNIQPSGLVTTELNAGEVIREEYSGGSDNTSVVLYTVNSEYDKPGGHVWFSEEIEGVHPNKILWDFLSSFRLDD